jgi:glutamine---fructose-6-phosphate transaminase (isomerizing)
MAATSSSTNFPHAMIREIYEQPEALNATLSRYVSNGYFRSDTCNSVREWLSQTTAILIAASGSSRHAGLVGEILIEDLSGIAVDVEYASEYAYRPDTGSKNMSVTVISQSGETSDTLTALRKANRLGQRTLAITNNPSSQMSLEATVSFATLAGTEHAVPATKSFITQLLNIYLISLLAAESKETMESAQIVGRLSALSRVPSLIASQLERWHENAQEMAQLLHAFRSVLFLGRGPHYPIAREGALKLKESAYIHAEGYPSGELKHGPNALVGKDTAVVLLATVDRRNVDSVQRYAKVLQLAEEIATQGARIIAIVNSDDRRIKNVTPHTIAVDETEEVALLLCEVVPLQLLSYVVAVNRGIDVDRPRNLSKAVLVE